MDQCLKQLKEVTEKYLKVFRNHYEALECAKKTTTQNNQKPSGGFFSTLLSICCMAPKTEKDHIMIKKQKVSLNTVRSVQFKSILKLEAKDPRDNFFDCSPKELIGEREFEYNKNTKKFGFHLKDENTQFSSPLAVPRPEL